VTNDRAVSPQGHRHAREVDEHLLAHHVGEAHGWTQRGTKASVVFAELGVGVAVGVGFSVLVPQQHQRHALATKFKVHDGPLGNRAHRATRRWRCEQLCLQGVVVEIFGQGPTERSQLRSRRVFAHGRSRNGERRGNLTLTQSLFEESKYFSDLVHGDAGSGHGLLLEPKWSNECVAPTATSVLQTPKTGVAENSETGGRIEPKPVAGFDRNGWPDWSETRTYLSIRSPSDSLRQVQPNRSWTTRLEHRKPTRTVCRCSTPTCSP
jgi:hypothetical protein